MPKPDYKALNKIILIDGEYETFRDARQWVLLEIYKRKDKDGKEVDAIRESYHSRLDQVCRAVLNRSVGNCESLEQIIQMMNDIPEKWASQVSQLN